MLEEANIYTAPHPQTPSRLEGEIVLRGLRPLILPAF
jgi:hypothetical protein